MILAAATLHQRFMQVAQLADRLPWDSEAPGAHVCFGTDVSRSEPASVTPPPTQLQPRLPDVNRAEKQTWRSWNTFLSM